MLIQQQKIHLSAYSRLYDLIVSKENIFRRINELIDFSFIYDELLSKYCLSNGRNGYFRSQFEENTEINIEKTISGWYYIETRHRAHIQNHKDAKKIQQKKKRAYCEDLKHRNKLLFLIHF